MDNQQFQSNVEVRVTIEVTKNPKDYSIGQVTLAKVVCSEEGMMDLQAVSDRVDHMVQDATERVHRQFRSTLQIRELEEKRQITLLKDSQG